MNKEDIIEVQLILKEMSEMESNKLLSFINEVSGVKRGIQGIKKAYRSIEIRNKRAKVKEDARWIYAGETFPIIEIVCIESKDYEGGYKKESMQLRLDLRGTKFEFRENKRNPDKPYRSSSTVINTEDLILID